VMIAECRVQNEEIHVVLALVAKMKSLVAAWVTMNVHRRAAKDPRGAHPGLQGHPAISCFRGKIFEPQRRRGAEKKKQETRTSQVAVLLLLNFFSVFSSLRLGVSAVQNFFWLRREPR
jgi:hypothetical protein